MAYESILIGTSEISNTQHITAFIVTNLFLFFLNHKLDNFRSTSCIDIVWMEWRAKPEKDLLLCVVNQNSCIKINNLTKITWHDKATKKQTDEKFKWTNGEIRKKTRDNENHTYTQTCSKHQQQQFTNRDKSINFNRYLITHYNRNVKRTY